MDTSSTKLGTQFTFAGVEDPRAKICVVGVGGGGGNAVNNMIDEGVDNVDFVAINTDAQALASSRAQTIIQAGRRLTNGMGAGARPDVGAEAIRESQDQIAEALHGYDMVFIAAGMGGGTGTGGTPVLASIVRDLGILNVAVVTTPFLFEGPKRLLAARKGTELLKEKVDTLIVISNTRLLEIVQDKTSLIDAFAEADGIITRATRGIADLVIARGLINLDFADIRTTIRSGGCGVIGSAIAKGDHRADRAAKLALKDPLLGGLSIEGARNVLVNVTGGEDLGLKEATHAATIIHDEAGGETEFIFGAVIDERMDGELRVTVVATGLDEEAVPARDPAPDRVSVERRKMVSSRFQPFDASSRVATHSGSASVNPGSSGGELAETSARMSRQSSEDDRLGVLPELPDPADLNEESPVESDEDTISREQDAVESLLASDDLDSPSHSEPVPNSDVGEERAATRATEAEAEAADAESEPDSRKPSESDKVAGSTKKEVHGRQIAEPATHRLAENDTSARPSARTVHSSPPSVRRWTIARWVVAAAVTLCLGLAGAWLAAPESVESLYQSASRQLAALTGNDATPSDAGDTPSQTNATDETQDVPGDVNALPSAETALSTTPLNTPAGQQPDEETSSGPGPKVSSLSIYAQDSQVLLFVNDLTDESAPVEQVEYRLLDSDGAALSSWLEFPLVPAGRNSYGVQMHRADLEPQILSRLNAVEIRATNGLGQSRTHRATVSHDGGA